MRVPPSRAATVAALALAAAACGETRPAAVAGSSSCGGCHSAPGEAPPFRDQTGAIDPGRLTVGAHDAHLHGNLSSNVGCGECHTVPRTVDAPGHLQDAPGDLQFGRLARTGGADPRYEGQGCAASYCHGSFPGGNAANAPRWLAGAAAGACGTCHAVAPVTGRHPEHAGKVRCDECHGPFTPATHVNGVKDVVVPAWNAEFKTCAQACHAPRSWPGAGG